MATLSITPASGSITAVTTACVVSVADATLNDLTAYDASPTPPAISAPELRYYFKAALSGQDDLKSHVFAPDPDGTATWNGLVFPAAGTWTLGIYDNSDDSTVTTASVVVA